MYVRGVSVKCQCFYVQDDLTKVSTYDESYYIRAPATFNSYH